MSVAKQNSFLMEIQGVGSSASQHLYVICENPCKMAKVVIVPLQTVRGLHDDTTIISPNQTQHTFLKEKSYIAYYEAQVIDISRIETLIANKKARKMDAFDNNTFLRIKNGIEQSIQTPEGVIECYKNMKKNTCCQDN